MQTKPLPNQQEVLEVEQKLSEHAVSPSRSAEFSLEFTGDAGEYILHFTELASYKNYLFGWIPLPVSEKRCALSVNSEAMWAEKLPRVFYLPDRVGEHTLIGIGYSSLREEPGKERVERLYIPDTVEWIGRDAISLGALKYLYIGRKVNLIYDDDFRGGTFNYVKRLEIVEVSPDNLRYTAPDGKCLFDTRTNTLLLGTVYALIPPDTLRIGSNAFAFMELQKQELILPQGVNSIGHSAFLNVKGVTALILPDSVTELGANCFTGCSAEQIQGGGYTVMPSLSFDNVQVTEFIPPSSLVEIEMGAFDSPTLKTMYIPRTVTIIGEYGIELSPDAVVYCEAAAKPTGWDENWLTPLHDGEPMPTIIWGAEMPE